MRRRAVLALALAVVSVTSPSAAGAACSARTSLDPRIPSPARAIAGFGERPASAAALDRYLRRLDRGSPAVRARRYGSSPGRRPLSYALAGDRAVLRRASAIGGRAAAAAPAPDDPVTVWLTGAVHGNEPSGAEAIAVALHRFVADRSCAAAQRRRRVLLVAVPVQNPDGRARGARVNAAGFDLNRDAFAATQPETRARDVLRARFPPLVLADLHEQAGVAFSGPPNAEPVHPAIAAPTRRSLDAIFGVALRDAFAPLAGARDPTPRYDLLFPGYADVATALRDGAAGMTFEQGTSLPLRTKIARQVRAVEATLTAAARRRATLVARTRAVGRAGRDGAASGPVAGWAVRSDRHPTEAGEVARRLVQGGVDVRLTRAATPVAALRAYGAADPAEAVLPAGTLVVPARQPRATWARAMLEPAPSVGGASSDATAWALPLLAGLEGGEMVGALPRAEDLVAVTGQPAAGRLPPLSGRRDVVLLRSGATRRDGPPGEETSGLFAGEAAMRFVLRERLGLGAGLREARPRSLRSALRRAGGAVVAADAPVVEPVLPDAAARALGRWVRAGGTFVGAGSSGARVAAAAGLTDARVVSAPGASVSLALARLAFAREAAVARGEAPLGWAVSAGDVLADVPDAARAARFTAVAAGRVVPAGALRDATAIADQRVGAGRVVLFAFDPAHRGYATGTTRLLANALEGSDPFT